MMLSIIIPVYNVQDYLARCLRSIIIDNECQDNYEIILIDDGSTDNSSKICDDYAKNYSWIKVIHKENGGLSEARNTGINCANGDYLMFVDSDDYLERLSLVKIVRNLKKNNPDVLIGKSRVVDENGKTYDEVEYSIETGIYTSESYAKCLRNNNKSVSFCAQYHICKKDFIITNKLFFRKGLLHEDELWTPKVLLRAQKIDYSDIYFYYHFMRMGSIMHSNNLNKRGESLLLITEELMIELNKVDPQIAVYYADRMTAHFLQAAYMTLDINKVLEFDRTMPIKKAYYVRTKIIALIYLISPRFYVWFHNKFFNK